MEIETSHSEPRQEGRRFEATLQGWLSGEKKNTFKCNVQSTKNQAVSLSSPCSLNLQEGSFSHLQLL